MRSEYHHEALPNPSTYIRLLELEGPDAWKDRGICCELSIWPLNDAPPYHAVSYTWGDPTTRRQVCFGNDILQVPESSINALEQLAYYKTSRFYWIDAICIAQGNNLREERPSRH